MYSDEELLEMLEENSRRLGRIPTLEDLNNGANMPCASTYKRRFGSIRNALELAGLDPPSRRMYSRNDLIKAIKKRAKELKRTPMCTDMPIHRCHFKREFGKWTNALEAAGFNSSYYGSTVFTKYTEKQLVEMLRKKARELGYTPRITDMGSDNMMPPHTAFQRFFGSWNKAIEAAGLEKNRADRRSVLTDRDFLNLLYDKMVSLGRRPKCKDINNDKNMPFANDYMERFGSWKKALEMIGADMNGFGKRQKKISDDE